MQIACWRFHSSRCVIFISSCSTSPKSGTWLWKATDRRAEICSLWTLIPTCTYNLLEGCTIYISTTRKIATFGLSLSERLNPLPRLLYCLISRTALFCRRIFLECSTKSPRLKTVPMLAFRAPLSSHQSPTTTRLASLMARTTQTSTLLEDTLRDILVVETCPSTLPPTGRQITRAQAI